MQTTFDMKVSSNIHNKLFILCNQAPKGGKKWH
jgi:hypothetical protein